MIELLVAAWLQVAARSASPGEVGSKACAGCHREIYASYQQTGMARSSGRIGSGAFQESFAAAVIEDAPLGVTYRVSKAVAAIELAFARPASELTGQRTLRWFVGSGHVGRSYLFTQDEFLFQAPVSYFSSAHTWGLSPGYAGKQFMDIARPVEPACLRCHASRLQPVPGGDNQYREPPFLEGGVSCERCHGAGGRHVAARGAGVAFHPGEIVNPAKLDAVRRDSICEQCHLTGAARVARAGRSTASYKPGERLSDHLAVFLWASGPGDERAATDHAEQLARSACKRASGDALACTACHDPHAQPGTATGAAFFRARCMNCHERKPCMETAAIRETRGNDCAACHMPKGRSREGEHVAYTDHSIPRRPREPAPAALGARELKPYWPGAVAERDLAIAYAGVGMEHPEARARALELLEKAEPRATNDTAVLSQLAQYYDAMGQSERAQALYERVLKIDPLHAVAGANVGVYWAQSGRMNEAIKLWERITARNPGMTSVAINLAVAHYRLGQKALAEKTLERVLAFHPDLATARKLLAEMRGR